MTAQILINSVLVWKSNMFFVRTAAEADLYPKHCDGVLFFRKSMIINWQYLDVYIIYVCFLPPLLPMCSNFYLTCLLLLVTEVMWQVCCIFLKVSYVCLQRTMCLSLMNISHLLENNWNPKASSSILLKHEQNWCRIYSTRYIYCIVYKTTYGKPKISAMYMNWYFTQIALYFYCLKTNDTSLHVFWFSFNYLIHVAVR